MMNVRLLLQTSKILVSIILILVVSISVFTSMPVSAKTTEEIQKEIDAKNKELAALQKNLSQAQKDLNAYTAQKNSSSSEISKIDAEIKEVEAQIVLNTLKLEELEHNKQLKELEKLEREKKQDVYIYSSYLSWKTSSMVNVIFSEEDFVKKVTYHEALASKENDGITNISRELDRLNSDLESYAASKNELEKQTQDLSSKKKELETQLARLNSSIAAVSGNVAGLRAKVGATQSAIGQLTEEQKAIKAADDLLTGGAANGGTKPIQSGKIYFTGRGRDLYQGHGIGMSQFGAYGAALKGWSAQAIVTFYYTQTRVEPRSGTVRVIGSTALEGYVDRTMTYDDYVAGLGEVPDKACGNAQQAAQNPAKYVVDNPSTIWDCWPAEAIKAQVIAARSYAASYGSAICTTAACQVYKGGSGKKWAADETSNQVIVSSGSTHNNQIIRALYSSDNNQGYGTANNDTVFSNFSGVGTAYSYLRHVNDTGVAASYSYTNWTWRTNSYSWSDIDSMFTFAAANYTTGGSNSFLKSVKSQVGTVQGLNFVRDGSNRVKQVQINGTNGSATMSGWLFKAIWNNWINKVNPSGQTDYIYSLTWFQLQG